MKIYFRSRGGKFYGWGNITRLSILANHLYKKGHEVYFIYEGDKYIKEYLNKFKFKKIKLREDIDIKEEEEKLKFLSKAKYSFIEMLDANIELQKFYKKLSNNLIIFDDLLDKYYISDYVISCQEHKSTTLKNLSKDNKTKILCNKKFFLLPEKFQKNNVVKKKINKVKSIIIFLGGGDYTGAYIKIAESLNKFNFKKITFIISKNSYNFLSSKLKKINKKIKCHNGTKDSFKDFNSHDIAIVSGGYTKFEAAASNTPCLVVLTQWHQKDIADIFCKKNRIPNLGYYSKVNKKKIIQELKKLHNLTIRKKIVDSFNNYISFDGIKNLEKEFQI